jgi:hypothetical protein
MIKTKYPNDLYEQSIETKEYLTMAVREGSYGIFNNTLDFKKIMLASEEL